MSRSANRIGTTLRGKYHLDALIGRGGMASVYAATHRNTKRFAIKILHSEFAERADVQRRFLREGYIANTVSHPAAVAVVDDDVAEDGSAFLVMELLHGESVDDLGSRTKIPVDVALCIVHQLLDVLVSAHAKGIVHRDIKPANIFLLDDGSVKVLDFGIARVRDDAASAHATQTGALMGTPSFLAPEQAAGRTRDVDGQSDIWSVGATLFEMLTGEIVHVAENVQQLLIVAATLPARRIASVAPDLPEGVARLVDKALAFDKAARFANARQMQEEVANVFVALFTHAPSSEPTRSFLQTLSLAKARSKPAPTPMPIAEAATPAPLDPAHDNTLSQPLTQSIAMHVETPRRSRVLLFLAIASTILLVAVVGVTIGVRLTATSPKTATSSIASPPPAPTPTPLPTVATSSSPTPTSITSTSAAPSTTTTSSVVVAPVVHLPAPAVKHCNPPYVIDSAGHHQYKPECL